MSHRSCLAVEIVLASILARERCAVDNVVGRLIRDAVGEEVVSRWLFA